MHVLPAFLVVVSLRFWVFDFTETATAIATESQPSRGLPTGAPLALITRKAFCAQTGDLPSGEQCSALVFMLTAGVHD